MLALKGSALTAAHASATSAAPPVGQLLDAVWPKGTVQVLGRDRQLYREGDPAESWYRLLSGTIRIVRVLADGRRHIGEFVFPGQFFGFEPGRAHSQGAEAVEPASVIAYPCAAIEQRIAQDPHARRVIGNLLVDRLAAAQARVLTLGSLNACGRMAAFLRSMARRSRLAAIAELPMSRVDIADYLGLTVETVSRVLTGMRRSGAIRLITTNRIEILDPPALEAASAHIALDHTPIDASVPLRPCA